MRLTPGTAADARGCVIETSSVNVVHSLLLIGTSIVMSLGSVLLYSVPLTAVAFQYFSLVEIKERTGLLAQIEALEAEAPSSPSGAAILPPEDVVPPQDLSSNEASEGRED